MTDLSDDLFAATARAERAERKALRYRQDAAAWRTKWQAEKDRSRKLYNALRELRKTVKHDDRSNP